GGISTTVTFSVLFISPQSPAYQYCNMRTDHHLRESRLRFWQITIIAVALTSAGGLSSCSPYAYSREVQSFSDQVKLIDTSYQESAKQTLAEKRLSNRIEWIRDKPQLRRGPGCNIDTTGSVSCDLAVATGQSAEPTDADAGVPTLPKEADVPAVTMQAALPD